MFRRWLWRWRWLLDFVSSCLCVPLNQIAVLCGSQGGVSRMPSWFTLQRYNNVLTQIPVMIHLGALMIHLWYTYVHLRAIRCTYEGYRLFKWRGNPLGMPMKRCKNDGEKMQGRHLMEHRDTKTQSFFITAGLTTPKPLNAVCLTTPAPPSKGGELGGESEGTRERGNEGTKTKAYFVAT